jgi:purine-nucleoside phosphorylase
MGVRAVILTNAAGGVRLTFRPGDLMVITDHINGFGTNPLMGINEDALGPRFPDMTGVYDPALRRIAKAAARHLPSFWVHITCTVLLTRRRRNWRCGAGADAAALPTAPRPPLRTQRACSISTITNMASES